ncbi:MAG: Peptidyl-prolyl isomerase, partial [Nitrosopumilales archaeon]
MMQPLSVNVKVTVITLFLVMVGTFISPTFAQQFEEPNYSIRRGEVLGFEIDPENTSLIISLKPRTSGELTITLPRDLIDAKIGSEDSDFIVLLDTLDSIFEETITSSDRTLIISFGGFNTEIIIVGTQVFSKVTAPLTVQPQQQIEKKIASELSSEITGGNAKLLIFSNTKWSGALQATSFDYTEIAGQHDRNIIFGCEPSLLREGIFGAKFQKMSEEGYLRIVAIQNQKIIAEGSTEEQFGVVAINGNCESSFGSGSGGGGCLIATATFDSELAPQVQQLRELRDNTLLKTESGSIFMTGFNQFYYSFSPTIADRK